MDILNSALSEEAPAQVEPVQQVEQPTEAPQEAAQPTGEQEAAPPAEQREHSDTAKGLQAALLAERRRRQELEAHMRQLQQPRQQQQPQEDAPPDPAQFQDNPQEYWRLLARYEARQELAQAAKAAQEQQAQRQQNERIGKTLEKLNAAVVVGQGKYQDFDAVINGGLAPFLNDTLREEIAESELGADIAYWLGKNPAEASRLASLDGRSLAREFVKLEAKVAKPPEPRIPQTLTQARDARGQFANANYDGPTPLDAVLGRKT